MWSLKYGRNEPLYETEIESWTKQTDSQLPRERESGMEWVFGVSICKPLHLTWINNKVLLYSIENYIQYPRINHNKRIYKKNVYMYITESLC